MNMSVQNNYDPDGQVGKLYPAVHFSARLSGETELEKNGGFDKYLVEIWFDDILYYKNDGLPEPLTLLEKWRGLKENAMSWLIELRRIGQGLNMIMGSNENIRFEFDGPNYNDRVATLRTTFSIRVPWSCEILGLEIDPSGVPGMPFPVELNDYENQFEEDV